MKYKTLILTALLCLSLSSCGTEQSGGPQEPDVSPDSTEDVLPGEEILDISTLLFEREDVRDVLLLVESRMTTGPVYAMSTQTEKEVFLDYLYQADMGVFQIVDRPIGMVGIPVDLLLQTEDSSRALQILSAEDALYFRIINGANEETWLAGPNDAFPFRDFRQFRDDIFSDTTDPDYAGTATWDGKEYPINRIFSARVRHALDGTLAASEEPPENAGANYDVEFQMSGMVYGIDSSTGLFYRNDGLESMYGLLPASQYPDVFTWLGVPAEMPGS